MGRYDYPFFIVFWGHISQEERRHKMNATAPTTTRTRSRSQHGHSSVVACREKERIAGHSQKVILLRYVYNRKTPTYKIFSRGIMLQRCAPYKDVYCAIFSDLQTRFKGRWRTSPPTSPVNMNRIGANRLSSLGPGARQFPLHTGCTGIPKLDIIV
jgi:hypothetical protein